MEQSQLASIINDFRVGYQIPPYVSDEQIIVIAGEAYAYLKQLKPNLDITDKVTRGLLMGRMFYSYNHMESSFAYDYCHDITTWQMQEVDTLE